MRYIWTILLILGCDGAGGAAGGLYRADAPHYTCTESDGIPCCRPPEALACPEDADLDVHVGDLDGVEAKTASCTRPDGTTVVAVGVIGGAASFYRAPTVAGGLTFESITYCDTVTGKIERVREEYFDERGSRRPCQASCWLDDCAATMLCEDLAPCDGTQDPARCAQIR